MDRMDRQKMMERMREIKAAFGPAELPAISIYEDVPCYPVEDVVALYKIGVQIPTCQDKVERAKLIEAFVTQRDRIVKKPDAPERIYLWPEGKVPTITEYTDNSAYMNNHNPDFQPYMFALTVPADVTPKGAVICCAGGSHGSCTIHEAYQTCLDFNELGYQAFLLNNRPNGSPWSTVEAGADASRAIRYVRAHAGEYRINVKNVAFAGFSNGGLTGESCIKYYSGTQTMADYFPGYEPDALDAFYGAPDAFLCVYGPRFNGAEFDYTGVVYPPTFFAVGRLDGAMNNLHWVYPDLVKQGVPVEVHTFAGTPHGKTGVKIIDGAEHYPNFNLWVPLADAFMQDVYHPAENAMPF